MWKTAKLGDVVNISIGKTPSRSENLSFLIHRWHRFCASRTTDFLALNAQLNELPIPYKIDLVLENHIKAPELHAHIARFSQIFYERKDVP